MFKKFTSWFFFTILAGILPIALKFMFCIMTRTSFKYSDICSEIYFFNIIISSDGLRELYEVDNNNKFKIVASPILLFTIIILSTIYGMILLNGYKLSKLDYNYIYLISVISTITILIISFGTRFCERSRRNEY